MGTYTLSGTTLARTTVLASSASGSAITLSAGTHKVYVAVDARLITASEQIRVSGFSAYGDGSTRVTLTAPGTTLVSSAAKTESFDADGAFNPATGIWQPTQSGLYLLGGTAIVDIAADTHTVAVYCEHSTDGSTSTVSDKRALLWRGVSGAAGAAGGSGAYCVSANGSTDRWRLTVYYSGSGTMYCPGIAANRDWIRFWARYLGESS